MANKNIEIEIHVKIENNKPLMNFLKKNGKFQYENRQVDEYFSPAHRDFLSVRPITEWLRLRDADGKYSTTYKNWHVGDDGKTNSCDEYETKVENLENLKNILKALNFKSIVTVDKLRQTWTYKNYEIAIDSVKNLGDYVEVEYIGEDENVDPKIVTKEMVDFLKEIGCGEISRNYQGYPFEILFPKETEYINQ